MSAADNLPHWSIAFHQLQDGRTALLCAAAKSHLDCVRLLVEAGADKTIKNNVHICYRIMLSKFSRNVCKHV
jgi:ankyrin repeat protein